MTPLREIVSLVQYGISELASESSDGVPILRMINLQNDGWDLSDLKYIDMPVKEAEPFYVKAGDILFNRTNSKELVGKCEVFREQGLWVFASYLIRVRLQTDKALSQFVSDFLNTHAGRAQIDQVSRQIVGMSNVNAEELKELMIPLPPLNIQKKLVAKMEMARESRRKKLQQANELIDTLDQWLYNKLGLSSDNSSRRTAFAIRYRQLQGALNPERYASVQIKKHISGTTVGQCCAILNEKISPSKVAPTQLWDRIRIDDLPSFPLQIDTVQTEIGQDIEGSFFDVKGNDILIARLGPTILNAKFVLCPPLKRRTVASAEFLVLRCKEGWNPEVVLWILRTRLFREIMYSLCRGGTPSRYRLNAEDLTQIPFPIVSDKLQILIATEVRRRREEARRLRAEAEAEWAAAKERFEQQLLGGIQTRRLP